MPRFHVRDSFAIHDQGSFVMAGFVIEGEVLAGMTIRIPFNTNIMMTAEIHRIEYVRRPDGDVVCLFFNCSVPDEATLWEALNIRNRTIEVCLGY